MTLTVSDSDLKVINAALAQLGHQGIASLTDNTIAGRTADAIYLDVLEEAIAEYPWRFARSQEVMVQSGAEVPQPWTTLWTLPAGTVSVIAVYEGDRSVRFDRFGATVATEILANTTQTVRAEISTVVSPGFWSGHFRRAMIARLTAAFAMPLVQDDQTAAYWEQVAAQKLALAKSRDAQGRSPSRIDTKTFIRARTGGR